MAAILDFSQNAMVKVLANHTTISGIPQNPTIDTKIMLSRLFCQKCKFLAKLCKNEGHLGFYPQRNVKNNLCGRYLKTLW